MDKTVKVMIVDDSATVRTVLGECLGSHRQIEIIDKAHDPIFALKKIKAHRPDVIVLDIEMPRMDGLTFLKKIMTEDPIPVVMCSSLTEKGSKESIRAMSLGAVGIIAKPKTDLRNQLKEVSDELIHQVLAAASANVGKAKAVIEMKRTVEPKRSADAMLAKPVFKQHINGKKVIAIGASTGGIQALEFIIPQIIRNSFGIVIVQHLPENFTRSFAERLDSLSALHVKEAEDNDFVRPGHVLIAPGSRHLLLKSAGSGQYATEVKQGPLVSRHRPSVDVLFRSTAKVAGEHALGIILTGMGDDGAQGLMELRQSGARTLGENKASCVVYGMPAAAAKMGAVQEELSLAQIVDEINRFSQSQ